MGRGSRWEPVRSFGGPSEHDNPVDALDAMLGASDASRFRSTRGTRAIVVPVEPPAGAASPIRLAHPVPGAAEILFLHPATAEDAVDLLSSLDVRAHGVRVALPEGGEAPGLVAEAQGSSVRLSAGPAVDHHLCRLASGDRDRLAAGPNLRSGPGPDGIAGRGRWFDVRHGGPA